MGGPKPPRGFESHPLRQFAKNTLNYIKGKMIGKQRELIDDLCILILFILILFFNTSENLITEILIPSLIILIASIFSREQDSNRYKFITALFGWTACLFLTVWVMLSLLTYVLTFFHSIAKIQKVSLQILALCLITAFSRDYEKWLKPYAPLLEEKIKLICKCILKK